MDRTFILTAELDDASFDWLNGLRRAHFPPERNVLPAHLTLFHRLSRAQTDRLGDVVLPDAPMPMRCAGVRLLGFGVAMEITCPALAQLRTMLKTTMGGELSRQDSQGWRPHVTIQNKVTADAARGLYDEIQARFAARDGVVCGLLLWEYLNGPWRLERRLPFER